jgi:hypothetical protein
MTDYFDELTEHDVDVVHAIVNSGRLDEAVDALEDQGALAEVAWLESVGEDLYTKLQVCKAVAVASANGQLENFRITIPGGNSDS